MSDPLSAELSLAATCCRWPPSRVGANAVRVAAAKGVDWDRFEAVVDRNRIAALVHQALTCAGIELPDGLAERLSRRATMTATQSLAMARESLCLQGTLTSAGLPSFILKGTPLAILAYGDLGIKESSDIDLLVDHDDVSRTIEILQNLGYESELSRLKPSGLAGYMRHCKEAPFTHSHKGFVIDLHWRMVESRDLLSGIDVHGPYQDVYIPGGRLRTPATEELFAYLCVHGSFHNWARLKWIADLGALLSGRAPEEIDRLCAIAEHYGAGRAASIGLGLCAQFFGIELGAALQSNLRNDRVTRGLRANVLAGLNYRGGSTEPGHYSAGRLRKLVAQFLIAPGLRQPCNLIAYYWNYPVDRMWLRLPQRLEFLYGALRFPLWLARLAARVLRRLTACEERRCQVRRPATPLLPPE